MRKPGQIVLFRLPRQTLKKENYALRSVLGKLPGEYDDWLVCMISSQTRHFISRFDEIILETDNNFPDSGLKVASVIRVSRLAVLSGDVLLGAIGEILEDRLSRIRSHIVDWISTNK